MPSTPTFKNLDSLVEQPDSGAMAVTRAGRTITKIYRAKWATVLAAVKDVDTLGTGDLTGYKIESSTATPEGKGIGKLVDVWIAGGDDGDPGIAPLPPDDVAVSPSNLSPRIEAHPMFLSLENIAGELANVETAARSDDVSLRKAAYDSLSADGKKLVDKIRRGNESYYLASLRYSWATHSYSLPTMTRGGYLDAPSGPLAGYFVADIDWLREADDMQQSNGVWRITRTWLGGPNGHWDADIYF